MEPLFVIAGICAFIALFVFSIKTRQRQIAHTETLWGGVADSLDGELIVGATQFLGIRALPEIRATIDGVDVHADSITRGSGKNQTTYTRIRAKATAPHELQMKVRREHVFSGLARAVGFQDVEVGDAEFDEAFVVKASDEMFGKAWLNRTVRNRIFDAAEYDFLLKRGRVTAEMVRTDTDAERLESAMRAVAAFADGKHHVVRVFRKLAKELGGKAKKEPRRWASLIADVDGIPIGIDTIEHGSTHYNVTTARVVGARLTPMVITNDAHEFSPNLPVAEVPDLPAGYGAWTANPQRAAAQLTAAVKKQIDALQPIKVRIDEDRVLVYLVGICPTLERMRRAVRIATAIAAGGSEGPYR